MKWNIITEQRIRIKKFYEFCVHFYINSFENLDQIYNFTGYFLLLKTNVHFEGGLYDPRYWEGTRIR